MLCTSKKSTISAGLLMIEPTRERVTEAALLAKLVRFAKQRGLTVIRLAFRAGVARGWPDLLVLAPGGQALFLEVKARGKKPTELQLSTLRRLDHLGFKAEWVDDLEDGMRRIEGIIRPTWL